jgi:hypothetical protein
LLLGGTAGAAGDGAGEALAVVVEPVLEDSEMLRSVGGRGRGGGAAGRRNAAEGPTLRRRQGLRTPHR